MSKSINAKKSTVVLLPGVPSPPQHERQSHAAIGALIAELLHARFAGDYQNDGNQCDAGAEQPYFIPTDTLSGETPSLLGIDDETDLFGGVVAEPFMATKAITHALVTSTASAPASWSPNCARSANSATLAGFTVFTLVDAERAGRHLLRNNGPLRIKPVRGKAGRGQVLVRDESELRSALAGIDDSDLPIWGLVLEEHLEQVVTYSVGQAMVAGIRISYYGTQRLTRDNGGESVYGGSDILAVRGGYEELATLPLPNKIRIAIGQARIYEMAARTCYPSLIASRLNYDIAQGINARGEFRSGVLEQSWRIGGASGAEVLALRAFAADGAVRCVRACTTENYGSSEAVPEHATLLFQGNDADVGLITKTACIIKTEQTAADSGNQLHPHAMDNIET